MAIDNGLFCKFTRREAGPVEQTLARKGAPIEDGMSASPKISAFNY